MKKSQIKKTAEKKFPKVEFTPGDLIRVVFTSPSSAVTAIVIEVATGVVGTFITASTPGGFQLVVPARDCHLRAKGNKKPS